MKRIDKNIGKYRAKLNSFGYLKLLIGWIAVLLPGTLIFGNSVLYEQNEILPSLSHYYYTEMGELYIVAALAVSFALVFYKGDSYGDNLWSTIAGLGTLGSVIFPTTQTASEWEWTRAVHFICAGSLFLCVAILCLFYFRRSHKMGIIKEDENVEFVKVSAIKSQKQRMKNQIYFVCGIGILTGMFVLALYFVYASYNGIPTNESPVVFVMECGMLFFLGLSWLVRGEFWIFKDPKESSLGLSKYENYRVLESGVENKNDEDENALKA